MADQQEALSRKLRGHYAHYGITGNVRALVRFRYEVERRWRKWLTRRSWATRMTWEKFDRLRERYPLPPYTAGAGTMLLMDCTAISMETTPASMRRWFAQ